MENILIDNPNKLSTVNYEFVLSALLKNVDKLEVEVSNKKLDFKNLDIVVKKTVEELASKNESLPALLEIEKAKSPQNVTINFKDRDDFIKDIIGLNNKLKNHMGSILGNNFKLNITPMKSLQANVDNKKINFGLNYDFAKKQFFKQRVSFHSIKSSTERLRVDEVEIILAINDIEKNLKKNLINYISNEDLDEDLLEERISDIENGKRGVKEVISLLNDESLARIKRTISYLYLEYLVENAPQDIKGVQLLKDYIRRFKLLDEYLKQLTEQSEQNSIVNINNKQFNICNLLSVGSAFSCLPFIGNIEGTILEDRTDSKKRFKLALKLKLNGEIKKEGFISSEYWLKYMNSELEKEKINEEKRVISFFLYSFMLNKLGDFSYNPIEVWNESRKVINDNRFDKLVDRFVKRYQADNVAANLNEMKKVLENTIKYKNMTQNKGVKKFTRSLILYNGILSDDLEGETFFKPFDYYKRQWLQYVSVVEEEGEFNNILLSIPVDITIKTNKLYTAGEIEQTNLDYDISEFRAMSIIMYPMTSDPVNREGYIRKFEQYFNEIKDSYYIGIPYSDDENIYKNNTKSYLYKLTYTTLTHLLINLLLESGLKDKEKKDVFIPIIRFHYGADKEFDNFIRSLSKTFEHLLSIDYRASSQGFNIKKKEHAQYIYKNAVSSLYSKLPKIFNADSQSSLEKLAILIVTSRKCDSVKSHGESKNTIIGEVVLFDRIENGRIKCDPVGTFSENYKGTEIYTNPVVLNDLVGKLYKQGYKDILYIANAPYTSKINITNEDENLFFMNESVLDLMTIGKSDLMVYPMFFEHFYAVDYLGKNAKEALYVKDTRELDENLTDLNKAVAGVFNLYSGKLVGNEAEGKHYRSVILYSTLCNKYNDKILNSKLYQALISNSSLKDSFTNCITLFHYSRYEADKNVSIKMNPYEKLMGDEGVSAKSIFELPISNFQNIKFNSLSYLTEIKNIVDREKNHGTK